MNIHSLIDTAVAISIHIAKRIFFAPVKLLVPRDAEKISILGFGDGNFSNNTKYLFCWLHSALRESTKVVFLCSKNSDVRAIRMGGGSACRANTIRGVLTLLTSGIVIVDCWNTFQRNLYPLYDKAIVVQLWHGVGIKEVELQMHHRRVARLGKFKAIFAKLDAYARQMYPTFDIFISTSEFYTKNVFTKSFCAHLFSNDGYSRNDLLVRPSISLDGLYGVNVDKEAHDLVTKHKHSGKRILLYAPTFRGSGRNTIPISTTSIHNLAKVTSSNNAILVVKMHPNDHNNYNFCYQDGIILVNKDSDVYPLLKHVDILITDYSSLCTDYLLVGRSIIFLSSDRKEYTQSSRHFTFDYESMTPGPKARTDEELESTIQNALSNAPDQWASQRNHVRALAFDRAPGEASARIWDTINAYITSTKPDHVAQ